jgi:hypothetical protein
MEKVIVKKYSFKELQFETKKNLVKTKVVMEVNLKEITKALMIHYFKEQNVFTSRIDLQFNPLYISFGEFRVGMHNYVVSREDDGTFFYSDKQVPAKTHLVRLKDEKNEFILAYLNVFPKVNDMINLIRGTLEDYFYEELCSSNDKIYLKDGTEIKVHYDSDQCYDYSE